VAGFSGCASACWLTEPMELNAMNDLDTLRPEVRAAMEAMDADVQTLEWLCIRAELLRLAALEHAWRQWIKDGMRVDFLPPEPPK
ncbi:MAG TPA: hypothetical protein VFI32_03210, partial [Rhodanobacteraceae bacterium]|nr:hypothetical protein [Rhodanobacteraceae bacterium]